MTETAYAQSRYRPPEIEHRYGPNVHLLDDPARLDAARAPLRARDAAARGGPAGPQLLYEKLAHASWPPSSRARGSTCRRGWSRRRRRPSCAATGIAPQTRVVTVGIARAGTMPSQVVYDLLNDLLDPACVRQDHLFMSRATDAKGQRHRGDVARREDRARRRRAHRALPRPDGRDGLVPRERARPLQDAPRGQARPLHHDAPHRDARVHAQRPRARTPTRVIYALRLDRGLSADDVLATVPGTRWDEEKGLDDHQYIVPGAGGVGEILNNAWV